MKIFKLLLVAMAFGLIGCEAQKSGNGDALSDPSLTSDENPPVLANWKKVANTPDANLVNRPDGTLLRATITRDSGGANFQVNNTAASISKSFSGLKDSKTGTLRLEFNFQTVSQSGSFLWISFATAVGLPAELRIGDQSLEAKCGSLTHSNTVQPSDLIIPTNLKANHVVQILHSSEKISIFLDGKPIFTDLACDTDPSTGDTRTDGVVKISVSSATPQNARTGLNVASLTSEALIRRVSTFTDLVTPQSDPNRVKKNR